MSDIQLFRLNSGVATELTSGTAPLEKERAKPLLERSYNES